MLVRLEHANICVRDFEAVIRFLTTAFPVFRVRGEGVTGNGTRWLHIGTDETYIALMQAKPAVQGQHAIDSQRRLLSFAASRRPKRGVPNAVTVSRAPCAGETSRIPY